MENVMNEQVEVIEQELLDGVESVPSAPDGIADSGQPKFDAGRRADADRMQRRLDEIKFTLGGVRLNYFQQAKLMNEYHDTYEQMVSRQSVGNSKPGRPGVKALMARELPVPGSTDKAKEKYIERALKVARLTESAQKAAVEAKLDGNRSALIKISEVNGAKEQVAKVREIVAEKAKEKEQARAKKEGHGDKKQRVLRFAAKDEKEVERRLAELVDELGIELI